MPFFNNDGIKIYYEVEGEGPPVILIHGFAASLEGNWKHTNWVEVLKDKYKLILLDCRGHGKSDKPLDPSQYGPHMTDDILKLLDHLSIEKANFFGYSMGSRLTLELLLRKQELFISAILGGFVVRFPSEEQRSATQKITYDMIEALETKDINEIKNPAALRIRRIISAYKDYNLQNLDALVAVLKGGIQHQINSPQTNAQRKESLKKINVPVLTVVGSDDFPGDKTLIAQLVPEACHFQIQGRDHINVVPDPKFHMVVKAFLDYVNKI
ncbi:MAG: alpha/beta fold hydrolase [Candidatus Hermodarchaeota archaeon]